MAEVSGSESNDRSEPYDEAPVGMASKVFISYPSQDVAVADTVCAALEAAGLPCWIAPRDVRAGESYGAAIVQAINSCRMLVLVLSKSAIDSPHVLREVERASSKRLPVLSIRMDATALPPDLEYFLSANHWLDASGRPIGQILSELIKAVQGCARHNRNLVSGTVDSSDAGAQRDPAQASGAPEAQRPSRSGAGRALIALTAVIGLALAYFVADRFWLKRHRSPDGNVGAVAGAMTSATAAANDKSIAVLPFADMSEKRDQEYFSDGMAEEIIDLLVKVPELKVPARTSSFYFKGKSTKIPEIARELGVAHVLEGSVRKSGNHLRVTAQLVRADNGYHLWSETYDRQLDDVFKMQDEIAGAVVKALKVSLLDRDSPSATLTTSSEAYELYLQARSLINRQSQDDTLKAYADLRQAVSLDPKFALAWATLAEILTRDNGPWSRVFRHGDSRSQTEGNSLEDWDSIWAQARAAARAAAEQAIKLGPDLAESHAAMAQVLAWLDWDWAAADAELKRARELEPGNARVTLAAADIAMELGRVSEGLELANRVAALDPLGHASGTIGWGQYASGALDEAQRSLLKFINLYPTAMGAHYRYGLVLLARGEAKAARSAFEQESGITYREVGLPLALDALGRRVDADRAIASAEQKWANGMAYQIAYVYASRKDLDRAFYWLERAYQQHDGGLAELKIDPMFRNLGRDPRFKALLRKMRLAA
jgi:TolB-like protein